MADYRNTDTRLACIPRRICISLIAAHAIGGYFFFLVARRGFGSVAYALLLTIIVMAFPWGYEALAWASAAAYAFASCLLWMILWALLSLRADQRRIYVLAAGLLFASFLCLLIHEAVFFSLCVAGFVVLDETGLSPRLEVRCGGFARAACRSVAMGGDL